MKKRLLWLLCILCTLTIFVGGTLAYFTDSVTATAEIKSAMIDIEQIEMERQLNTEGKVVLKEFSQNRALYPAIYPKELMTETFEWKFDENDKDPFKLNFWSNVENAVDKVVFVKNNSTTQAAFRTIFTFEAYTEFTPDKLMLLKDDQNYEWTTLGDKSLGNINGKTYYFLIATYKDTLEIGEIAPPSLLQVALSKDAGNKEMEIFGDTYEILVVTQATQAKYGAPKEVFKSDPKSIVEAVVNEYYKPANPQSPIYPPNESSTNESSSTVEP